MTRQALEAGLPEDKMAAELHEIYGESARHGGGEQSV